MIPCVRFKEGVIVKPSPGGVEILAALSHCAKVIEHDITVTSGNDGVHSGPSDPHFRGDAYDNRTHDLPDKQQALQVIKDYLGDRFFSWIEDEGQANEHIHTQVRKGTMYPPQDENNHDAVQEASI